MNIDAFKLGIHTELSKAAVLNVAPPQPKRKSFLPKLLGGIGVAGALGAGAYGLNSYLNKGTEAASNTAATVGNDAVKKAIPTAYTGANMEASSTPKGEAFGQASSAIGAPGAMSFIGGLAKNVGQWALGKARTGPGAIGRVAMSTPVMGAGAVASMQQMNNDPLIKDSPSSFKPNNFDSTQMMLASPMTGLVGTGVSNQILDNARKDLVGRSAESASMQSASDFLLANFNKIQHNDPQKQDAAKQIMSWLKQNESVLPAYKENFPSTYNLMGRSAEAAQKTL